jgi:hypothetical protein
MKEIKSVLPQRLRPPAFPAFLIRSNDELIYHKTELLMQEPGWPAIKIFRI